LKNELSPLIGGVSRSDEGVKWGGGPLVVGDLKKLPTFIESFFFVYQSKSH
jgi:hypothetical protein